MESNIITGSLIDVLSWAAEVVILIWFFGKMHDKAETHDSRMAGFAGMLPLVVLLGIYMTPLNAAISVFSIENLLIQILRMFLHLLPVMCWLLINKECTRPVDVTRENEIIVVRLPPRFSSLTAVRIHLKYTIISRTVPIIMIRCLSILSIRSGFMRRLVIAARINSITATSTSPKTYPAPLVACGGVTVPYVIMTILRF